jgi:hypothetical protein
VAQVPLKHLPDEAKQVAVAFSEDRWTHDFPITVEGARELWLPVSRALESLLPQLCAVSRKASRHLLATAAQHAPGAVGIDSGAAPTSSEEPRTPDVAGSVNNRDFLTPQKGPLSETPSVGTT